MTDQNNSSSSVSNVCSACQYCWRRKIKCSDTGDGCCEACKAAGVQCVGRARGQTGRPKGSRKHSWRINTPATSRKAASSISSSGRPVHDVPGRQHVLPNSPPSLPSVTMENDLDALSATDFYSTFMLDTIERPNTNTIPIPMPLLNSNHASMFPSVFDHYLKLYNLSQSFTGTEDAEDSLIQMLEDLSELVRSLTSNGANFITTDDVGSIVQWSLQDSTLLFLFLTVLRAIEMSKLLLPTEAHKHSLDLPTVSEEPQLFDMNTGKPFLWQDLNMLTPHTNITDLTPESNSVFDGLSASASQDRQPRAMILTRLDMVLFDFSRFERRFSQLLLMADGDRAQQDLRARLALQNEQCLSSLRLLHSRIHDYLHITVQQRP